MRLLGFQQKIIAVVTGLILLSPVSVLAVNDPNDWIDAIHHLKDSNTAVDKEFGNQNLTNCACLVKYMDFTDQNFFTGGIPTFDEAPNLVRKEILNFYENHNNWRFFWKGYYSGYAAGASYEMRVNVNLEKGECSVSLSDPGENLKGYFETEGCKINTRSTCCCDKDDGQFSTRYSNCAEVSLTKVNTGLACGITVPNDNQSCKSYEGKVVNKPGATQPKGATPEISLGIQQVKAEAAGLNQLNTTDANVFIGRIIKGLMAFIGMIMFVLYIYAGLLWMLASGNDEQITKAKNILVWATLGVAVMLASYVIVSFVFTALKL